MNYELQKFKELYFKQFGVIPTDEKAEGNARVLINLYKAVYGSPDLTQKEYDERRND